MRQASSYSSRTSSNRTSRRTEGDTEGEREQEEEEQEEDDEETARIMSSLTKPKQAKKDHVAAASLGFGSSHRHFNQYLQGDVEAEIAQLYPNRETLMDFYHKYS